MIDFANKTVLSFFAHPDDETLAAGATFAKLNRMGSVVHVAIPATGVFARKGNAREQQSELLALRKDCKAALGILGVSEKHIYIGDFPDNELDTVSRLKLAQWLEGIIEKVKPDIIFTHHINCTNIDHRYCHEAVVVATRPSLNSHIAVIAGEVPSSTGYLKPTCWEPNLFIVVSEKDLKKKIRAMQTYKGEARPDPHPRSPEVLTAYAKVRGSDSGAMLAESFMIQKSFHVSSGA